MSGGRDYTEEEIVWIISNAESFRTYGDLYDAFICKFPYRKYKPFRDKCKKIGIRKVNCRNYTEEERQWILDNYERFYTIPEMLKEFSKTFSRKTTYGGMQNYCRYVLGIKMFDKYKEQKNAQQLPVGTERYIKSIDTIYVKCKLVPGNINVRDVKYKMPYWKPKQMKIYEDYYGEVPKGSYVIFLNTDNRDFSIENLYCINRKIHAIMAKNNWFTTERENTLTAIKCCELMQSIKGGRNE